MNLVFFRNGFLVFLLSVLMLPFSLCMAQGEVFNVDGEAMRKGSDILEGEIDKQAQNVNVEDNFEDIVVGWTNFLMAVTAIVAVLVIIWAGIRFVSSLGDDSARESAQKIIVYTVIGLLVIFAAYALTNTLLRGLADNEPDQPGQVQIETRNFLASVFSGDGVEGGSDYTETVLSDDVSKEPNLKALIKGWINFALGFLSMFCVVVLVWAGVMYVTSVGDDSRKETAQKIIIYTVVGLVVILGAYAIVNSLILTTIDPSP